MTELGHNQGLSLEVFDNVGILDFRDSDDFESYLSVENSMVGLLYFTE